MSFEIFPDAVPGEAKRLQSHGPKGEFGHSSGRAIERGRNFTQCAMGSSLSDIDKLRPTLAGD
jgi:hypothetical protein